MKAVRERRNARPFQTTDPATGIVTSYGKLRKCGTRKIKVS